MRTRRGSMPLLRSAVLLAALALAAALFALTPDDTAQAQMTGPTPQEVPVTWALLPDGLGPGDQFRLLFVTSGTSNASSGDINVYNTFVQNAANANSVDATIRGMSGEFRAVVSTSAVACPRQYRHSPQRRNPHLLAGRRKGRRQLHRFLRRQLGLTGRKEPAG